MKKQWRCFHCDVVFTRYQDAVEHFGRSELAVAGCQLKGHEHGLLGIVRDQEQQLAHYRAEDSDALRVMATMQSEHVVALRRAEEDGYSKGLHDGAEQRR